MNSERKEFWEWAKSENPLLVEEAETGSQFHKDVLDYMFMGWDASAQRQGYKLVLVYKYCSGYGEVGCQFEGTFTCPECNGDRVYLQSHDRSGW